MHVTDDGRRNSVELKEYNIEGGALRRGFAIFHKGSSLKFSLEI